MNKRTLWRISVETSREAEEAVTALLERLFGQTASTYTEEGKPGSTATVYSSRPAREVRPKREALKASLEFLASCELDLGPASISIRRVPREDWSESWKKYFKALEFGTALLIKPSWSKRVARKGEAVVTLDPGLSFGTGQHPTTAFCLGQLVHVHNRGQAQSFLDIGTGTGILAIAAVKLGFHPVRALDFDPVAVRIAKSNARKNRVEHRLRIVRQDLTKLPLESRDQFGLICANLVDDLLISQVSRILNRLRPGGRLVLAGVLTSQFPGVSQVYESVGLVLETSREESGWTSGAFVTRGPG